MVERETNVDDVVLPIAMVTLTGKGMRTKDGKPLVVRVEYIDEEEIVEAAGSLPGSAPELGIKEKRDPEDEKVKTAKSLVKLAPKVLDKSCVLLRADGSEVRPAFYWGENPETGALPGKFLSFGDKLRLVLTLLRLCGYVGGAADKITFRDEDEQVSAGGAPPVDAGGGGEGATGGAGDGQAEGVEAPAA